MIDLSDSEKITFQSKVERFEQMLSQYENPIEYLLKYDDLKEDLGLLLKVFFVRSLKLGPDRLDGDLFKPSNLINLAQEASAEGILEVGVLLKMRNIVDNLKSDLIQEGMWRDDSPLWWEPLPHYTFYEEIWMNLAENFNSILENNSLFPKGQEKMESGWFAKPDLIDNDTISRVNDELIKAQQNDKLLFEEEGTGELATISSERTDTVLYFMGQEKELLENAPYTATLIQWLLKTTAPWIGKTFSLNKFVTPQKAMLSRYHRNSKGYNRHLDNPGGKNDNGRYLTLIVYLNSCNYPIKGGELAMWNKEENFSKQPNQIIQPVGGTAILFKSREIPHQVMPLKDGPDRWALVIWFNDQMIDSSDYSLPEISLTEVLLPLKRICLPDQTLLFHKLNEDLPIGRLVSAPYDSLKMRIGIISTVYRSSGLEEWCRYHYSIGVNHICLVFDHMEDKQERQLAEKLLIQFGKTKISVWNGDKMNSKWDLLKKNKDTTALIELTKYGGSTYAISARQTLNASVALQAAKTNEFGGDALDWLIHLDDDEYFYLEGNARGGDSLQQHFSAATKAGIHLIRYVNHELIIDNSNKHKYKLNPLIADCILGPIGWMKVSEYLGFDSEHSYFSAYSNGKSAVYVPAGISAAGMHSWHILDKEDLQNSIYLAGPSILHRRFFSFDEFKSKYLAIATSLSIYEHNLFPISSLEKDAVQLIHKTKEAGGDINEIEIQLHQLYNSLIHSKKTIQILEKAGLIIIPEI